MHAQEPVGSVDLRHSSYLGGGDVDGIGTRKRAGGSDRFWGPGWLKLQVK